MYGQVFALKVINLMDKLQSESRHERLALLAAGASLVIGWVGSMLFYDWLLVRSPVLGIGFPLLVAALIIGVLMVARVMGVQPRKRVLWLLLPIGFFAGMVAVRADSTLMALNISMTVILGGLLLHYLPLNKAPHEDNTPAHVAAIIVAGFYAVFGSFLELSWVRSAFQHLRWRGDERTRAVLRGIFFAVPVVVVFGVLLASADTVFSEALGNLFSGVSNLGDLLGRVVVAVAFAWGILGLIAYGVRAPLPETTPAMTATTAAKSALPTDEEIEGEIDVELVAARAIVQNANKKTKGVPALGMIETSIVLGSVIALFAVFVTIQFAYLFGGQANIREGVTYAQYARRGFFELVAVAVLVIGLGRYLHMQTRRASANANVLFRVESVALVGLTLVLLASAWYRMSLYEAAYGFTQLRLYIYVFMAALVVLFGFFLLEVFTRGKTIFAFGVLLVLIGYGVALNGIGGEGFIAARNIERYENGKDLDICYLKTFSVDALPQMLTLLNAANERSDGAVVPQVHLWLREHSFFIDRWSESPEAFTTLNASRVAAKATFLSIWRDERAIWDKTEYTYCRNNIGI